MYFVNAYCDIIDDFIAIFNFLRYLFLNINFIYPATIQDINEDYEGQSKISESCSISDKLLLVWVVFV